MRPRVGLSVVRLDTEPTVLGAFSPLLPSRQAAARKFFEHAAGLGLSRCLGVGWTKGVTLTPSGALFFSSFSLFFLLFFSSGVPSHAIALSLFFIGIDWGILYNICCSVFDEVSV